MPANIHPPFVGRAHHFLLLLLLFTRTHPIHTKLDLLIVILHQKKSGRNLSASARMMMMMKTAACMCVNKTLSHTKCYYNYYYSGLIYDQLSHIKRILQSLPRPILMYAYSLRSA